MGTNTSRYISKSLINLTAAFAAGSVSYWLANSAREHGGMFVAANFNNPSAGKLMAAAKVYAHEGSSNICIKRATGNATQDPKALNEPVYIQCMSEQESIRVPILYGGLSLVCAFFGFRRLRDGVSFAHLALRTRRHNDEDETFRLIDEDETANNQELDEAYQDRFDIVSGLGPQARMMLESGETAISERGAMLYKGPDIEISTTSSKQSAGKNLIGRIASGEGLIQTVYTNTSAQAQPLAFQSSSGDHLTSIPLTQGSTIFCQNGAFAAASAPVSLSIKVIKNLSFQTFGGQGLSFQKVTGQAHTTSVLLSSASLLTAHTLEEGESLDIQNGSLFALTSGISLQLTEIAGTFNRIGSGEKAFMTRVTGPGTVWISAQNPEKPEQKSSMRSIMDRLIPGS